MATSSLSSSFRASLAQFANPPIKMRRHSIKTALFGGTRDCLLVKMAERIVPAHFHNLAHSPKLQFCEKVKEQIVAKVRLSHSLLTTG